MLAADRDRRGKGEKGRPMTSSYDTPTKYQIDRISEELSSVHQELRGAHQQLRELNSKLTNAGYFGFLVLSIGFFGFLILVVSQAADRA